MNSVRFALRQTSRRPTAAAALLRGMVARTSPTAGRYLTTASQAHNQEPCIVRTKENVDFVRQAINNMLTKEEDVKPISNENLEQSLSYFANLYKEAQNCINDCKDVRAGSLEFYEEVYTAQKAVDEVFSAYIDLLDDFRRASDEQLKSLCQNRLSLANSLKCLRQELHEATKVVKQQKATA